MKNLWILIFNMKENQRNSPLRKFLEPLLTKVARELDKIGVKANQVTAAGTYLTALGSFLKMSEKNLGTDLSYLCLGLFVFALACDGLDGSLARLSGTAGEEGAKYDLINDRVQELLLNAARIANASQRMDIFGVLTATLAGLTNPLPSYIRAMVEEKGDVVAETGKNPLSFLGTRGPRAGLAISARTRRRKVTTIRAGKKRSIRKIYHLQYIRGVNVGGSWYFIHFRTP
jgi:phosphatidylglycerophosphate synthase